MIDSSLTTGLPGKSQLVISFQANIHQVRVIDNMNLSYGIDVFEEYLSFSPEGGNGNPLQCPCLENSMVLGVWWVTVDGVAKSQTQLSD